MIPEHACPICLSPLSGEVSHATNPKTGQLRDAGVYPCLRCGVYELTGTARAMLDRTLDNDGRVRAAMSHAVWQAGEGGTVPVVASDWLPRFLEDPRLPSPAEMSDNLISYVAENTGVGGETPIGPNLLSVVGAQSETEVGFLAQELAHAGLLYVPSQANHKARLTLAGDRLRVDIRNARFVVTDLTHDNYGAYWEAGFAEGLGKPVIFTCESRKFDKDKTHFDTNHHHTVLWDEDDPAAATRDLIATIRATLPGEAVMEDDGEGGRK